MESLVDWIFSEYESRKSILGLPRELFFMPHENDPFRVGLYDQILQTPFGVAAGPHTQMAQNIVLAWLTGSRIIELKTVQILDKLDITKPCIDMQDEGYNIEWSQELLIDESIDEYVRAWVLVHALHSVLDHPTPDPQTLFNMSVGYNLEGVKGSKIQRFIDTMLDAKHLISHHLDIVRRRRPDLEDLSVPSQISSSVTLSTMHGCPPDEIGRISSFLMNEWRLHTSVKLNPTLLGPEKLRSILHNDLGWSHVDVPDAAFGHDIKFDEAIGLLQELEATAETTGVTFGVKLTNTLEVKHNGEVFDPHEASMYLSGRPLHALSVNVAHSLSEAFDGRLLMSFAGGADAFNAADLLTTGLRTVTTCSDVLRPGGYSRMLQYIEATRDRIGTLGVSSINELILATAGDSDNLVASARKNLAQYASRVRSEEFSKESSFDRGATKTARKLDLFDCTEAPCRDACSVDQGVPQYMRAVHEGDLERALQITNHDNPLPAVLGHACTHPCEPVCLRTHYDQPLAIREIKRFIMEQEAPVIQSATASNGVRIAIIGGGPCGLSAATFLGRAGFDVTIFERQPYSGGMVEGTIPVYRTSHKIMNQDLERVKALGVHIEYGREFGTDFNLEDLESQGFAYSIIAAGAQEGWTLGIPGETGDGVFDGLNFLRQAKHGTAPFLGQRIVVIGGGDVAMDCARTARRLSGAQVSVMYRRTRSEMPAQNEEIEDLLIEGARLVELVAPLSILRSNERLTALRLARMKLGDKDASGRRRPVTIPGDEFEVEVDSIILAIGQKPTLEFLSTENIELTKSGHVVVDEQSLETTRPRVYAGGDAISGSTLSIVRACGHGRQIAQDIQAREKHSARSPEKKNRADRADLLRRRAHRQWRVAVPHLEAEKRNGFDEVVLTLQANTAREEAARCLDCDLMCSTCETVCPNHAIFTYEVFGRKISLPRLVVENGQLKKKALKDSAITQTLQVGVLTDFCNECGNCTTFCPTSGEPYRDKPRLYLNRDDFEAESDNAFMMSKTEGTWRIEGRFADDHHRIDLGKTLRYYSPEIEMVCEPSGLKIVEIALVNDLKQDEEIDLAPMVTMLTLLEGIRDSMPGFPMADGW